MTMECDLFLARLDSLETGRLPSDLEEHAAGCVSCARTLARVEGARRLLDVSPAACLVDLAPRVGALLPFMPSARRRVQMRDWLLAGALILGSMAFVPFLADFSTLRAAYGNRFVVPLGLVLGMAVTAYGAVFIAGHLDEFSKRWHVGGAVHR